MTNKVTLVTKKAEELKEIFPDGTVPITQIRADYDPNSKEFYFHVDSAALSLQQIQLLVKLARSRGAPESVTNEQIINSASVKKNDACCLDCGKEGPHNCQSEISISYPEYDEDQDDDWEDEDDDGSGAAMVSDVLERQLTMYKEPNQCRFCGKLDYHIIKKEIPEKFCSTECHRNWLAMQGICIAAGYDALQKRGFD